MPNSHRLKAKVSSLPDKTGVYIFKDRQGEIIYVGKAKSLKKRVQSYFNRPLSSKTQVLVAKIAGLEYRITRSESQAQLQEASLIKDKQPQYNISLKDDKSFPLIRITQEEFPVVSICRKKILKKDDSALYFGPYTNAKLLRQAFKIIRRIFGFRSCKKMPRQACLYYRIKLCPAPCVGAIDASSYQEIIKSIALFLESKYEELLKDLSSKMQKVSSKKDFEAAARIRDQINSLAAIVPNEERLNIPDELEGLKKSLQLDRLPLRIEAFDVSNISGQEACGSMVSFLKGAPDKNNYRRFRIKTVYGIDDYAMIREVVRRRYQRLTQERLSLPDLVLIDGGKAHLRAAENEIKKLKINLPLVSIAKEKEHLYIRNRKLPIRLKKDTPALNLIRRIRDEAHRFAINYHHLLRRKKILGR